MAIAVIISIVSIKVVFFITESPDMCRAQLFCDVIRAFCPAKV
jgi:hypothetical protein